MSSFGESLQGVFAPVVTPFDEALRPDAARLIAQCRWLLDLGCGLAVFGTNSEGNSLSVAEKIDLIDQLVDAGIDSGRLMPGTGACALPDAIALAAHVAKRRCGGALALPPFYYKAVTEDGLFRFFAEVIERVGSSDLRLYLYHIPQVAVVGFTPELIERLIVAYPQTILGIKDSTSDFAFTKALLERFPGWGIFPGNETNLLQAMRLGAVGCISATANVNPAAIVRLAGNPATPDAGAQQEALNRVRSTFSRYPMIPAMKATIAAARADEGWTRVRPPLEPLAEADRARLAADLDEIGYRLMFA